MLTLRWGDTADAVSRALQYPGRMVANPGVLTESGLRQAPIAPDDLAGRVPVVAIGSNGCAVTLLRKLRSAHVPIHVPVFPALVVGLGTAHSAHVSLGGYVAAAPLRAGRGVSRAVLAWFTREQIRAMDASEPNYQRVTVNAAEFPLVVVDGQAPQRFGLYRSAWGVLAPFGRPLRLRSQARLLHVMGEDETLRPIIPSDPATAVRVLQRPEVQSFVRRHWARSGQVAADHL